MERRQLLSDRQSRMTAMPKDSTASQLDDIIARVRAATEDVGVRRSEQRTRGDHDLNPGLWAEKPLTPAAVLVPIAAHPDQLTVLLTRRTAHLHDHAGQISFPGGRVDPCDENPVACALREAEEEVGLPRAVTEVIGRLDTYQTRTGFEIVPVVAILRPPFDLRPDPFEVAEAFEVPLDFIVDPANHRRDSRVFQGSERHFWAMPFGTYYIWGATAGMLVNLSEVLRR
jgi:8-oxo-dGTP pyrophosphatase MutT (NUDIX family)